MSTFYLILCAYYKMSVYRYEFKDFANSQIPWHEYKYCIAIIGFSKNAISILLKLLLNYELQQKIKQENNSYDPIDHFKNQSIIKIDDRLSIFECSLENSKYLYAIAQFEIDSMSKVLDNLKLLPRISSYIYAEERYEGKKELLNNIYIDTCKLLEYMKKYFNQTSRYFCPLEFNIFEDLKKFSRIYSIEILILKSYFMLNKNSWDYYIPHLKRVLSNICTNEICQIKKKIASKLSKLAVPNQELRNIPKFLKEKAQNMISFNYEEFNNHHKVKLIDSCTHILCFSLELKKFCNIFPTQNIEDPYVFSLVHKKCSCGIHFIMHELIGLNITYLRLKQDMVSKNSLGLSLKKCTIFPQLINRDLLFNNHLHFEIRPKDTFLSYNENIHKLLIFIGYDLTGKRSLIWSFVNYLDLRKLETIVPIEEFDSTFKNSYTNMSSTNIVLYTSKKQKKYALVNISLKPSLNSDSDAVIDDAFENIKSLCQHKKDITTIFFVTRYHEEIDNRTMKLLQKLDLYEKVCIYTFYDSSKKNKINSNDFTNTAYINNSIFSLISKGKVIKEKYWENISKKIKKIFCCLRENRRLNIALEKYLLETKVCLDGEIQENILSILKKKANNLIEENLLHD